MNTLNIITTIISALCLAAYIVVYIKNVKVAKIITSALTFLSIGFLFFRLLAKHLPDSRQIMISEFFSTIFLLLALFALIILKSSEENSTGKLYITARYAFYTATILSELEWILLFYSTFFLFRPKTWITVTSCIIFACITAAQFICMGRQKIKVYILALIPLAISVNFSYIAFVNLIATKELLFILLLAGTIFHIALTFFHSANSTRWFFKHSEPAYLLSMLFSQSFICFSALLMISK